MGEEESYFSSSPQIGVEAKNIFLVAYSCRRLQSFHRTLSLTRMNLCALTAKHKLTGFSSSSTSKLNDLRNFHATFSLFLQRQTFLFDNPFV
jgi:hypothetical protein